MLQARTSTLRVPFPEHHPQWSPSSCIHTRTGRENTVPNQTVILCFGISSSGALKPSPMIVFYTFHHTSVPPCRTSVIRLEQDVSTGMMIGPFCWCETQPLPGQPVLVRPAGAPLVSLTTSPPDVTYRNSCGHGFLPRQRLLPPWSRSHAPVLEHGYWWIGMNQSTRWWFRHCPQCQARTASRQTMRWPVLSLPFPSGLDIAISVGLFPPPLGYARRRPNFHRPFQAAGRHVCRFRGRTYSRRHC